MSRFFAVYRCDDGHEMTAPNNHVIDRCLVYVGPASKRVLCPAPVRKVSK